MVMNEIGVSVTGVAVLGHERFWPKRPMPRPPQRAGELPFSISEFEQPGNEGVTPPVVRLFLPPRPLNLGDDRVV